MVHEHCLIALHRGPVGELGVPRIRPGHLSFHLHRVNTPKLAGVEPLASPAACVPQPGPCLHLLLRRPWRDGE